MLDLITKKIKKNDILFCDYDNGHYGGFWKVKTITKKTLYLVNLENFTDYKELKCRFDNKSPHCLKIWYDGTFTIYPNRDGTPYYFF